MMCRPTQRQNLHCVDWSLSLSLDSSHNCSHLVESMSSKVISLSSQGFSHFCPSAQEIWQMLSVSSHPCFQWLFGVHSINLPDGLGSGLTEFETTSTRMRDFKASLMIWPLADYYWKTCALGWVKCGLSSADNPEHMKRQGCHQNFTVPTSQWFTPFQNPIWQSL